MQVQFLLNVPLLTPKSELKIRQPDFFSEGVTIKAQVRCPKWEVRSIETGRLRLQKEFEHR
jgi:hypothetical protein